MENDNGQFERMVRLVGEDALRRLAESRVAVFGIGGVGSFAVEALARAGTGALDLIDHDVVALSNINRQLIATHSTIGRYKTEVAAKRIKDIHPGCQVTEHRVFYLPETKEKFRLTDYDYIIDAIDTVTGKLALIEEAKALGIPIISAMGAGNKLDPSAFRVKDIYDTAVCPLARIMRRELKKRGITSLKVVCSEEPPLHPAEEKGEDDRRRATPGSVSFVPPVAGMILAGEVIRDLIEAPSAARL